MKCSKDLSCPELVPSRKVFMVEGCGDRPGNAFLCTKTKGPGGPLPTKKGNLAV